MNPLAKKLQMKAGQHWLLYNAPETYLPLLEPLPDGLHLQFEIKGSINGIQLFVKSSSELTEGLKLLQKALSPGVVFWVIYPKKSSGITTDLEMMGSWQEAEKYGWTSVAAAAVDQTWTALRFRPIEHSKISDTRNSELSKGDYAEYIDVANRQVTLPADVATLLKQHPAAIDFYDALSYSNKKEYILWVLTAKQEKTRLDRLQKMLDKLLKGKRNPAEK